MHATDDLMDFSSRATLKGEEGKVPKAKKAKSLNDGGLTCASASLKLTDFVSSSAVYTHARDGRRRRCRRRALRMRPAQHGRRKPPVSCTTVLTAGHSTFFNSRKRRVRFQSNGRDKRMTWLRPAHGAPSDKRMFLYTRYSHAIFITSSVSIM